MRSWSVPRRANRGPPAKSWTDAWAGPGQANEQAVPLNGRPPVEVKMDLSAVLADGLREAARHPPVPGLPFLRIPP
ncbi:MAG: hypothetical protein NTU94_18240 [Planctomycetota bacterium]|nr:hypothetical protein [Planctomycetota bacterium]